MAQSIKQTHLVVFVFAAIAGSTAIAGADQWTDLTPPGGAVAVAMDPSAPGTLYVGGGGGLQKHGPRGELEVGGTGNSAAW